MLAWSVRCFQDPGEPFSASSLERSPSLIWRILEIFLSAAQPTGLGEESDVVVVIIIVVIVIIIIIVVVVVAAAAVVVDHFSVSSFQFFGV